MFQNLDFEEQLKMILKVMQKDPYQGQKLLDPKKIWVKKIGPKN